MDKIIKRDSYLRQLINKKENGLIKVITGIRRSGKSFLLFNLFYDYLLESGIKEDHIIAIALDDDMFADECFRLIECVNTAFYSTVNSFHSISLYV